MMNTPLMQRSFTAGRLYSNLTENMLLRSQISSMPTLCLNLNFDFNFVESIIIGPRTNAKVQYVGVEN